MTATLCETKIGGAAVPTRQPAAAAREPAGLDRVDAACAAERPRPGKLRPAKPRRCDWRP